MIEMKYEWKKSEKELYQPKETPALVTVPAQKFFKISGKGNPNDVDFADRIGVLYSLAYAVRMMPRNGFTPEGYFEYTVYPLEGLWDLSDEGRKAAAFSKDDLIYTIMIRQPEFVTQEVAQRALDSVRRKKPNSLLDEVVFEVSEEELCVQVMHTGSYDDEPESFAKMKQFIAEKQLEIVSMIHREIYIKSLRDSDSAEEKAKLKTILRYSVRKE
jgi:hypothetical protein